MPDEQILLSHGSGGTATHRLIREVFLKKLSNPVLAELADSARLGYHKPKAFTTDSFVVSPLVFPGGDIGKLAVCGTVNDLVVVGAVPEFLSLAVIIEEGLPLSLLAQIVASIARQSRGAGVRIVTGDVKVVEKGAADKLFITTSGVGSLLEKRNLSVNNVSPGDKVIISGTVGQHGMAVLAARKGLGLGLHITSDCAALNSLLIPVLRKTTAIKCMRDPTRGGVATTLNEIAAVANLGIYIDEKNIPVSSQVRAACELTGIDPLYAACEGRAIIISSPTHAEKVVTLLRRHPLGRRARIIGEVRKEFKKRVILNTSIGTQRFVDMLTQEPLPRIC